MNPGLLSLTTLVFVMLLNPVAARRGVEVRVIVASSGDSRALNLSNDMTVNAMLRNGIRVYAYPGMTHVKAAVYDGWACLGSANFDKLSLQVNQEINLGTSHPETVQRLLDRVFYTTCPKCARTYAKNYVVALAQVTEKH